MLKVGDLSAIDRERRANSICGDIWLVNEQRTASTGRMEAWDAEYGRKGALWRGVPQLEIEVERGERVLELGCGNGKTLAALSKYPADIIGMDFSRRALQGCQRQGICPAHLVQGDLLQLPFRDGVFDHVICFHVLEHLTAAERPLAAEGMFRLLRTGGHLHVQVFSADDMRCGKGEAVEEMTFLRGNGISYHYFTRDELGSLFHRFRLVQSENSELIKRYHGMEERRSRIHLTLQKLIS